MIDPTSTDTRSGPPGPRFRPTQARIDLGALRRNVATLRSRLAPGVRMMAVVKSNCYGHEATLCVPELVKAGADMFGVATVEGGRLLRRLGVERRIVVLSPPIEGQMEEFGAFDLEPMISTPRMARELAEATPPGTRVTAHLFVDTGMGRNGARPEDVAETLRAASSHDNISIRGFASHFATSDELGSGFAVEQLELFEGLLRRSLDAGYSFEDIHLANSGGLLNLPASHFTLVRPGLALYGYHPTVALQNDSGLEPVMTLRTTLSNITPMPAGVSISYGRRYYTTGPTRIATIPIGYGDGLMRSLTNRLRVLVRGRRYPIVGTICMDEVMIDLGGESDVEIGDEAVLIGTDGTDRIDAWELATAIETIPYEICTHISARVPRVPVER